MSSGKEILKTTDLIIISKDYKPKSPTEIEIEKYYDAQSKRTFTFSYSDNLLYLFIHQNIFGSAFYGNLVMNSPLCVIAKKFDPVLLLINFIAVYGKNNEALIDKDILFNNYREALIENQKENISLEFIQKEFEKNIEKLDLICEVKQDEEGVFFKLSESKIIFYLNNKLNLSEGETKKIENENPTEDDRNVAKERVIKEKCEIFGEFLPEELSKKVFHYKGIKSEEEKAKEPVKDEKRKKVCHDNYKESEKKPKARQPKVKERPSDVKDISSFFKPKKAGE
ncbi:MAG: hypothetical protein MJ252_09235 [archaeon]|nr:hypothetical protein [archaeon]